MDRRVRSAPLRRDGRPHRTTRSQAVIAALALVAAACGLGTDEDAVAACGTFQEHLESMRAGDDREQGLALAQDAADEAARSGDDELAEALEDYNRVIVRFALADDDVRAAQHRLEQAGDADLQRFEDELAAAEERLAGLIEAGDLVLTHVNASCDEHDVTLR